MSALVTQLGALGLTLVVEIALAFTLGFALAPAGRRANLLWTALFANLASHSLASAALWACHANWFAVEGAVAAFEMLAFRAAAGLSWGRAAALSLVANAASAALAIAFA